MKMGGNMVQDYYLGLDIGTGSLGWAVTDSNYQILKKHGKMLWGVRLFESAKTAEERRTFRTARRCLDRKNWRIKILQELFAEEISNTDTGFYLRMKESKYYPEDKLDSEGKCPELPYALFVDSDYTDKDFYKQFPTIYHLRKWLMETEETPDIRLVYLAIHHMMKHRGHFLLAGDISQIKEFDNTFKQFVKNLQIEELDWSIELDGEKIKRVENILKNRHITRTDKKTRLIKVLFAKSSCEKAILTLISGGTAKLSDIFGDKELDKAERPKVCFSDNGYDDYVTELESELGEQYYIIESAKSVYDWSMLVEILGDSSSISEAKVKIYEKHKKDLMYLKHVVREYLTPEEYQEIFVISDGKVSNYCSYIGMTKKNGKKIDLQGKKCSRQDFYDFLKKNVLKKISDSATVEYIEKEMACDTFLPKQVDSGNCVIPYQIHSYELKIILQNLSKKIPFIKEKAEKIIELFEFRVPYYVGPLNNIDAGKDSKFTWAVRKSREKIYPWNFEQVIDIEASAERFIRRMTNKCTYLAGEDVLPKDSLLYSKFMVLNELNNLKLNGIGIDLKLKQKLYEDLFCRYRKVTQKKLKKYLVIEGITDKNVEITGIDNDFKASLTAYHDFKEKLTDVHLSQNDKENIVLNIVLFGEDKKLLKRRLKKLYPDFTENQLKGLCSLNYSGWGRLSKTFLENIIIPAPETGEVWNIITALWETNENLNQLLSNKYTFMEEVNRYNEGEKKTDISYKTVEELYVSPAVKRQIWQTLKVVREICKVMGCEPKRVFIEMAREKQESKRTESRKSRLIDLYKSCKNEERNWISELESWSDQQYRSDKLYLYYTQKGKCMYSGEEIHIEDLWDNTKYDIDHIYPQSKTIDDSLDNRVLVKKIENETKSDIYPVKQDIYEKRKDFWNSLLQGGFISKEKYNRLTRRDKFTEDELAGFIERQIVETRQSTKAVAEILKQALNDSKIIYVKAATVTRFRQDFEFIKVREMNDLHHAKDAYLNVIVGNTYFVKFTQNAVAYIKNDHERSYNLKKLFKLKYDIKRNGETAWKAGENGTIVTVKKVMDKNNILVTRKAYEVNGGLFDRQIMKKGKGQIPIKGSDGRLADIEKYGGYNKATGAYFMLIKSKDKKGKEIRTLEFIPVYLKKDLQIEDNAIQYLIQEKGLKEPEILLKKVKIDTLFKVDGFKMWLSGRTGCQVIFKGAIQLILEKNDVETLKKVLKFVQRKKENKNINLVSAYKVTQENLLHLYDAFLDKLKNSIYNKRLSAQLKTLGEKRGNFIKLCIEDKCIVLGEILHLFQCQSGSANLKSIGGPGNAGILLMNNNITGCNRISIINQSVTGIFEKEIDLLAL